MTLGKYMTALLIAFIFTSTYAQRAETIHALRLLDADVAQYATYTSLKLSKIQGYKNNLKMAVLDADAYLSCKQIADAYSRFDSDSALYYLQRCYNYGMHDNNEVWKQDAVIHSAYILADRGDNYIAFSRLNSLGNISHIHPRLRQDYACAMMMGYVRTTSDASQKLFLQNAAEAWEKYRPYISKNITDYYLFLSAIYSSQKQYYRQEPQILRLLKKTKKYTTEESQLRMLLSIIYVNTGQEDKAIEQLALSAATDVRCANKNSTSIIMLTSELNTKKISYNDLDRLMHYLEVCTSNVSTFKDVGRSIKLVSAQKVILNEYGKQIHTYRILFFSILSIAVFLIIAICFTIYRHRRQRHKHEEKFCTYQSKLKQLENTIQTEMAQKNAKEAMINELQTHSQKFSKVLANQFVVLSSYLEDIKNYKKDIANLIVSGKISEARKAANNTVVKDQTTKVFYQLFDQNFLFIHPDFPDKLNALLRPECQLKAEKEGTLTPEQRIYALICLGIDESQKIVEILHYSVQTIYNIRHSCIDLNMKIDDIVLDMYRTS